MNAAIVNFIFTGTATVILRVAVTFLLKVILFGLLFTVTIGAAILKKERIKNEKSIMVEKTLVFYSFKI